MDLNFQKLLKFPRKIQTINAQCNNVRQKVICFIAGLKSYQVIQQSAIISLVVNFIFVYTHSQRTLNYLAKAYFKRDCDH